jgi:hypothetical protein
MRRPIKLRPEINRRIGEITQIEDRFYCPLQTFLAAPLRAAQKSVPKTTFAIVSSLPHAVSLRRMRPSGDP